MPGAGKTSQAVAATRCLEDSLHASIMNNRPESLQGDGCGEFSGGETHPRHPMARLNMAPTLLQV
jgi:hypothetical protein